MAQQMRTPIKRLVDGQVITIHITGLKVFGFRFWLASLLIKIGAVIMPVKTKVHVGSPNKGEDNE